MKLRVLDLFSGIGGFSLGLERTGGFETVAFCEIDPFCREVLAKHWPDVPCYEDVRDVSAERLAADGIAVDVITGGFPCQDISCAGGQRGMGEGTRSGLWSEIVRIAGDLRPRFIIVENVAALLSGPAEQRGGWFGRVLGDLARIGYDAWWQSISAAAVGLPHQRKRVWIMAYTDEIGRKAGGRVQAILAGQARPWTQGLQMELCRTRSGGTRWVPNGVVCTVDNGFSANVDGLGAAGNAVVPQIPEMIGRAILEAEAA